MLILGTQQCQLVCGNSASAYYFGAVKDGTKCVPNGKDNDVCVQGACKVSLCKKKFLTRNVHNCWWDNVQLYNRLRIFWPSITDVQQYNLIDVIFWLENWLWFGTWVRKCDRPMWYLQRFRKHMWTNYWGWYESKHESRFVTVISLCSSKFRHLKG